MKVKELISKLKNCNKNSEIYFEFDRSIDSDGNYIRISENDYVLVFGQRKTLKWIDIK